MSKGIRVFVESILSKEEGKYILYCRSVGRYTALHPGVKMYDSVLGEYTVEWAETVRGTLKGTAKILLCLQEETAARLIGSVLFTSAPEAVRVAPSEAERRRLLGLPEEGQEIMPG